MVNLLLLTFVMTFLFYSIQNSVFERVRQYVPVKRKQIIISFINAALSGVALLFIGFPQVLGLAFMIFVLGLIPVAGVLISLVPLSLFAFKLGGVTKVLYVLIMIALLHGIESYLLNPKLMSKTIKLPVFFTFLILIISEHFWGIWGLLVGLPLFTFFLDLLDIKT